MKRGRFRGMGHWKNGIAIALVSACSCAAPLRKDAPDSTNAQKSVQTLLERQVEDWNEGDLDGFMKVYWNSPDLCFFSDGALTRGWRETFDRYRKRYPDRRTMGRLTFDDLVIQPVHGNLAVASGRWRLQRDTPVGGRFFLVFERRQGQWVIVVDSTTSAPPGAETSASKEPPS